MLSEAKKEILGHFGGYLAGTETLELEAKFGTIKEKRGKKGFVNEIPYIYFDRLRSQLSNAITPTVTKSTDETSSSRVRKTTLEDGSVRFIRKRKIMNDYDSLDFGVRLSLSSEDTLPEAPKGWTGDTQRIKTRWSFPFKNGQYRLDMTSVDQTIFSEGQTTNRFEIELELVDITALDDFFLELNLIFKLIYGTQELWTFPERDNLIRYVNGLLQGNPNSKTFDIGSIRQARNLRWDDLVFGGIVGHEDEKYVIYHKVDGVRKMVVCAPSGVWIVYPNYEFNKLSPDVPQQSIGSVLFVEEVPVENRKLHAPNAKHWCIVFDCVAFAGLSYNRQFVNLEKRTIDAQKVTDMLKEQFQERLLAIGTARYRIIRSPDEFFSHCREFLNQQENSATALDAQRGETGGEEGVLTYKTDGLIFVPFFAKAQHGSDKLPLNERVLTKYPDSCKWKPQHLITNDLSLRWKVSYEGETFLPEDLERKEQNLKPIRTLDVETFTIKDVLFQGAYVSSFDPKLNEISSGEVVTFKWHINQRRLFVLGLSRRDDPMNATEAINRLIQAQDENIPFEERKRILFDFRIIKKGNTVELYTFDRVKIPFRGTEEYPFDPKNIRVNPDFNIDDLPTGAIVEFQATPDGGILPLKLRPDKTLPNKLDIVLDNWNLSKNPISRETMMGETFDLLERYKERSLIRLLNYLPNYNEVLLIGKIPRLNLPTDKFISFQTSETIQEASDMLQINALIKEEQQKQQMESNISKITSVIFYQSLSQLENSAFLQGIFDNLPVTGSLIYLDLDGDAVKHLFFPAIKAPEPSEVTIGPIVMRWQDGETGSEGGGIIIEHLKDKRIESPNIVSLFNFLEPTGPFQIDYAFRLDEEKLMHQAERLFGDLHSAFILTRISQDYKIVPMQRAKISPVQKIPEIPFHPDEKVNDPKLSPNEKAMVLTVEDNTLPMIRVEIPYQIGADDITYIPRGVVAAGDDTYEPVVCTWYPGKVVRIATIGDGSCFFHAVLKGYDQVYQENNEAAFRVELVAKLRRDLAAILGAGDPENPDPEGTYYDTAVDGHFLDLAQQQRENPELIRTMGVDFSLEGLQALFNSNQDVGEEVYKFVSEMLGVDIYVLRGTKKDLFPHSNTSTMGELKRSVIIMGNTYHYEVIGIDTPEGFQTMFPSDHPFLVALRKMNPFGDEGGFK